VEVVSFCQVNNRRWGGTSMCVVEVVSFCQVNNVLGLLGIHPRGVEVVSFCQVNNRVAGTSVPRGCGGGLVLPGQQRTD